MQLDIQSINFNARQDLLNYIQKKLNKLETFYDGIIDTKVYMKVERTKDDDNKSLEIKVNVYNQSLFCSQKQKSFESATDIAVEALKIQLKKYKQKIKAKKVS